MTLKNKPLVLYSVALSSAPLCYKNRSDKIVKRCRLLLPSPKFDLLLFLMYKYNYWLMWLVGLFSTHAFEIWLFIYVC